MEIAGLLKKKKKRKNMMMTRFVKSRVSGFSRGAQEAHTTLFGMWIARYWPVSDFWLDLKTWLGILAEFLGVFYADHVRFDLRHPYIERLPTL